MLVAGPRGVLALAWHRGDECMTAARASLGRSRRITLASSLSHPRIRDQPHVEPSFAVFNYILSRDGSYIL